MMSIVVWYLVLMQKYLVPGYQGGTWYRYSLMDHALLYNYQNKQYALLLLKNNDITSIYIFVACCVNFY